MCQLWTLLKGIRTIFKSNQTQFLKIKDVRELDSRQEIWHKCCLKVIESALTWECGFHLHVLSQTMQELLTKNNHFPLPLHLVVPAISITCPISNISIQVWPSMHFTPTMSCHMEINDLVFWLQYQWFS